MSSTQVRLYGKTSTKLEVAQEVVRLMMGDKDRSIPPMSINEIIATLGFSSRQTFYNYKQLAIDNKLVDVDKEGNVKLPELPEDEQFVLFNENHPITKDPLVEEWRKDLMSRKQGSKIATWQTRIRSLEIVCNALKINPKMLLRSLKDTEKYMRNYNEMYRAGKTPQKRFPKKAEKLLSKLESICIENKFSSSLVDSLRLKFEEVEERRKEDRYVNEAYTKAQGVRDFCGFYGIVWKRGSGGVMSQKVTGHGKYADIKLSDEQIKKARDYIVKKWGIDSDVYRWFFIGIESCARFGALFSMNLDYERNISHDAKITTYLMKAYESKTKQLKGGMWTKFICRRETQQSIDSLKSRGGIKIYETPKGFSKNGFTEKMNLAMCEIFLYLGITTIYFYEHTNHVFRHIGAHYWLAILDYDYGRVAIIGGWHTVDELIKSYGEMPANKVLEGIQRAVIVS